MWLPRFGLYDALLAAAEIRELLKYCPWSPLTRARRAEIREL